MIQNLKIILAVFMIIIFPGQLSAQGCCTAGTSSLGGIDRSIISLNNLSVTAGYDYNYLGDTYNGREKIDDPLNRNAAVTYFTFQSEYGISEKVSLLGIMNFTTRERNVTYGTSSGNKSLNVNFTGNGFGDIILIGKYEVISPDLFSPFTFAIGGGVKLPTGAFRKKNNGARLAIDLQPGTGATDAIFWSYLSNNFQSINLSLYANLLYRYSGTNFEGYKIGNELIFLTGTNYYFTDYLSISLQLRSRFSNADYADGRFLPSTGATSYNLYPYLNYFEGNFSLRLYTQIPLYRNARGIQLTVSEVFGVQAQQFFNFNNF